MNAAAPDLADPLVRHASRSSDVPILLQGAEETPSDDSADRLVRRVIATLPGQQRSAMVLRFYLNLSVQETARQLGTTPKDVRSVTKLALVSVREQLESVGARHGGEERADVPAAS